MQHLTVPPVFTQAKKRLLDQIGDMKDDMHTLRESLERTEQLVSEKESNFERERSARLQIETESERAMQRIKTLHESAVQDKDKVWMFLIVNSEAYID